MDDRKIVIKLEQRAAPSIFNWLFKTEPEVSSGGPARIHRPGDATITIRTGEPVAPARAERSRPVSVEDLEDALDSHLRDRGLSMSEAVLLAQSAMFDLAGSKRVLPAELGEPASREAALRQVGDAIMKMREVVAESFGRGRITTLPDRAPALWSDKAARLDGESPVGFLRRVWGPYIRAGILYQDDIKRLGDDRLVANVRAYCHHHGLDAASVLPPPRKARIEAALKTAVPGSAEAEVLKHRLRARRAGARYRHRTKNAPSDQ